MRVRWGAAIAALAIVAVAACGDDGGGGITEPTDEPTELTTDEWIEEADALCTEGDEAEAAAGERPPGDPRTVNLTDRELTSWGEYFDSVLPVGRDLVVQFGELETPDEIATQVESIAAMRDETVALIEEAVAAAEEGDQIGFRTAVVEALEAGEEIDALYEEIGTQVCGQDGATEPSGETIPVEQWTDEVLAICETRSENLGAVPEPSAAGPEEVTEAELPEVEAYFIQLHEIYSASVDEIAAVGTPEGAESDGADFLEAENVVVTALDDTATAAASGDADAFRSAFDAISPASADVASIGQDLGVEACGE